MEALDDELFKVSEQIVYEMIHNRHKHQHEEHLKSQRFSNIVDEQKRRKHHNSRRNDVSNKPIIFGSFGYSHYFYYILHTETGQSD